MINASGGSTPNPTTGKKPTTPVTPTVAPVAPTSGPGFPTHNPAMQHKNLMPKVPSPSAAASATPSPTNSTGASAPATPKFPDPTKNLIKVTNEKADKVPGGSDNKKDTTKPKKKFNLKLILGVVVLLLILIGSGAGFYLSQQTQELRQKAYVGESCTSDAECNINPTTPGITEYCGANNICTTTPPVGPLCPNPPNLPIVWCATFNCPNGDTTGDGECNVDDDGASYTTGGTSCPNPSSGCGQVDYYSAGPSGSNWGAYCGHTFLDFDDCGGGDPECGDGIVQPPEQCDDGNSNNDDSCRNDCTNNTTSDKSISGKVYCEADNNVIKNVPIHSIDSIGNNIANTITNTSGTYNMSIQPQGGDHFAVRVSNASGTALNAAFIGAGAGYAECKDGAGNVVKHESCEFAPMPNTQPNMDFKTNVIPTAMTNTYDTDGNLTMVWNKASNYDGSKVTDYILRLDYDESQDAGTSVNTWKPGTLADGGNANDYWRYVPISVGDCTATTCTVVSTIFDTETGAYAKPWKPGKYFVRVTPVTNSTPPSGGTVIELCTEAKTVNYTEIAPECGDGNVDPGEACDDGNTIDDDACSNACTLPNCGDGIVQSPEECDDGNTVDDDACTNLCTAPICGDGIVQPPEACDDGNTVDDDDCSNSCTAPICGDGIIQEGETCDDGEDNSDTEVNACRTDCTLPICGDGVEDNGEACDDGNTVDDDECTNACTLPNCGDGIIQPPEACDDGNTDETDECRLCKLPTCGDGTVDDGETCDDGNSDNNDSCRNDCTEPSCGDGTVDDGESCDDGNTTNGDGCSSTCTEEVAIGCNDTCVTNADCADSNHICTTTEDGSQKCRLDSYPTSTSCTLPATETTQPTLPPELPQSGPGDWLNWFKAGLVTMGLGAALFFLL